MRKIIICLLCLAAAALSAASGDFTYRSSFLWNDIRSLQEKDGFLFCAFRDGIGSINLELDFNKKKLYSFLEISGEPVIVKINGNILAAQCASKDIKLIDISDPGNMQYLGSFTPDREVYDFAVMGSYIYTALEYDGLSRYDFTDPGNIIFDDSSMAGIHVVKVFPDDTLLYVLDDYNGALIYNPGNDRIGAPISTLYLPRQAISLAIIDDTLYAGTRPSGYMEGYVGDAANPVFLGSVPSFIRGDYIAKTTNGMVISNSVNGFELIYNHSDSLIHQLFLPPRVLGPSETFVYQGWNHIAYPHRDYGFVAYNIDYPDLIDLDHPTLVFASPGPITQVSFVHHRLHTIGTYNWYQIYNVSDPDRPALDARIINPPYRPAGMCHKGDTLFLADFVTNGFFHAIDNGTGDPSTYFQFFSIQDVVARPYIIPDYFDDGDLIYIQNGLDLNGSMRNDSTAEPNRINWKFGNGITSVEFYGDVLYQANSKGMLNVYEFIEDYAADFVAGYSLPGRAAALVRKGGLLFVGASGLLTYSLADPLAPERIDETYETGAINAMTLTDGLLVCAARNGVFIFDVSQGLPRLLFSGAEECIMAELDGDVLATSDGYSVKIWTLAVLDADNDVPLPDLNSAAEITGYPNPFNPDLTLVLKNFRLSGEGVVIRVFDILGREVDKLNIVTDLGGSARIHWNGRSADGAVLSSGVYLFQAVSANQRAVFKAILLK